MGKWAARLAALDGEKKLDGTAPGAANTDKSRVLSVLAVPAPKASREIVLRQEERKAFKATNDLIRKAWYTKPQISRFVGRVMLLMSRGVDAGEADELAERLHVRDVDREGGREDRVMCLECAHCRPGRPNDCANEAAAGPRLRASHMYSMLQRCRGFRPAVLPEVPPDEFD